MEMRIRMSDHHVQHVTDLKDFPTTGRYNVRRGVTPDGSPMALRDAGSQDVYARLGRAVRFVVSTRMGPKRSLSCDT
jgi:hypothetical protein